MRESLLMIATGQMGVGKSHVTTQLIEQYHKTHRNRRILIFDVNNEEFYHKFQTIHFDILEIQQAKKIEQKQYRRLITESEKRIMSLPVGQVRRVIPFTTWKDSMNLDQKRLTFEVLLESFRGGLLFFEDINKYITSFADGRSIGAFKAIRHNSQDIILHMQSFNPVRPILFEAASCFRMHYDGVPIDRMASRFQSHFEIFKIAQLIVDEEYLNRNNPHFYCYVYHKHKKIKGVTEEQFMTACKKYLSANDKVLKPLAKEIAYENKRLKPTFHDIEKAKYIWVEQRKPWIDLQPNLAEYKPEEERKLAS